MRSGCWKGAVVALIVLGPACMNAPVRDWCPYWGRAERVPAACLERSAAQRYLDGLAQEIAHQDREEASLRRDAYSELRFTLHTDGAVGYRCVSRSNDTALAVQLLAAFDRAAPFPPVPDRATCLAGHELTRSLRGGPPRAPTAPYVHRSPDPSTDPEKRECFERPAAQRLLESLHGEVAAAWRLPPDIPADRKVVVVFRLHESGDVSDVEVVSSSDDRLRESVVVAFEQAAPFSELSAETACLADIRLRAAFSNPVATAAP